jgi:hypothetical protein
VRGKSSRILLKSNAAPEIWAGITSGLTELPETPVLQELKDPSPKVPKLTPARDFKKVDLSIMF